VTAFDAAGASSQATAVVTVTDTPPPPPTPPRDSVGVNVVKNPSFEFDVSGWKGYHGGTIARAPGGVDGNGCVQIRGPAVPVEDFGINDGPNWVTSVPAAGTRYRVTAWVRALGVLGTVRIQMREYANGVQQAPAAYSRPVTLGLLWQELALDFTTLTTGSTIDVQIIDNPLQTGEAFYADNISIRMLSATEPELAFATRAVRGGETGAIGAPVVMAPRVSPNPMRGRGAIDFATAMPGALHVALYDVTGRVIRVLADERMAPAGSRRLDIDGRDQAGAVLPAGVYYYRVVNSGGRFDGRVVLVK
jgi:hypothetical protein